MAAKTAPSITLDSIKAEVQGRMESLRPAAQEFSELDALWGVLSSETNGSGVSPSPTAKRLSKRPASRQAAKRAGNHRGRPKGSGKRAEQILALLTDKPGLTTTQVANELGIKANYLYRVMPDMVKAGALKKNGSGFSLATPHTESL